MTSTGAPVAADPAKGTVRGVWFRLLRMLLLLLAKLLVGLRMEGLGNVPRDTGVLVVANHLHNADPLLMSIAFPRPLHFMAKEELIRIPVLGWLLTKFGNFPVA
ncbi:MAG: lysophospholipid acyltransferase family protein, partial [Thermomicrobiales bacterium]